MSKLTDAERNLAAVRAGIVVATAMIEKKPIGSGVAAGDFAVSIEAKQMDLANHQSRSDGRVNAALAFVIKESMGDLLPRALARLRAQETALSEELLLEAARLSRVGSPS